MAVVGGVSWPPFTLSPTTTIVCDSQRRADGCGPAILFPGPEDASAARRRPVMDPADERAEAAKGKEGVLRDERA